MSGFYLTLPSNSSMDYHPENTLTNFVTRLPTVIDLEGSWEVALMEIQYPHTCRGEKGTKKLYVITLRVIPPCSL